MKYKNIILFEPIIDRPDFTYICKNLTNIIAQFKSTATYGTVETIYIAHLRSLAGWMKNNPDAVTAIKFCIEYIEKLQYGEVSNHYARTWKRKFLYHVNQLRKAISKSFRREDNGHERIEFTNQQILNWILDEKIGLGSKYDMQPRFITDINNKKKFASQYKLMWERLTENPPRRYRKAKDNKTRGFGQGKDEFRILGKQKLFGKISLYAVFTLTEKLRSSGKYTQVQRGEISIDKLAS